MHTLLVHTLVTDLYTFKAKQLGISAFDFQIHRPSIENSFYNTAH